MKWIGSALRRFYDFWVDFLVGDAPEIFIGVLAIVGGALLLRHNRPIGIAVVLVLAVFVLIASTYHGRRRSTS
jgi:hypothetical protein